MSSARKRSGGRKANIDISKPEAPAFLQRMREQIAANEDQERREQSQRKREERRQRFGPERVADEDEPAVVRLAEGDIDEQEYKRIKRDLETKYKLEAEGSSKLSNVLDIDDLLVPSKQPTQAFDSKQRLSKEATLDKKKATTKRLSYGSSDDDDDDD